eukprot:g16776.t1
MVNKRKATTTLPYPQFLSVVAKHEKDGGKYFLSHQNKGVKYWKCTRCGVKDPVTKEFGPGCCARLTTYSPVEEGAMVEFRIDGDHDHPPGEFTEVNGREHIAHHTRLFFEYHVKMQVGSCCNVTLRKHIYNELGVDPDERHDKVMTAKHLGQLKRRVAAVNQKVPLNTPD